MGYNKARAEKEWLEWKNKEETQLRELGVDEDTIQFLHTYDWEMFKADRNYRQRHINIGTIPEIVSEDSSTTPRSVEDFLDNIEDERLYRLLREVDSQTLQMLFLKSLGYTAKEIEQRIGMPESMVHNRISRLRKNIKKIYKNQRFSLFSVAIWMKGRISHFLKITSQGVFSMPISSQVSDMLPHYHDTLMLLKKYRDIAWIVEVSSRNLQEEFRAEYGCPGRDVLNSLALNKTDASLMDCSQSLEHSAKMLHIIDSAVDLIREKHKKGELYYWILYYAYLSPHKYENSSEILRALESKAPPISLRTYYARREEAIELLSSVL